MQTKVLSFFNFHNYDSAWAGYHILTDFSSKKLWWIYHTVISGKWTNGYETKEELDKALNAKAIGWNTSEIFINGGYHHAKAPDDWINGPPDKIYTWEDILLAGKDAGVFYHWENNQIKAAGPNYVKDVLEPALIADGFNGLGDYSWGQFFQMIGWASFHQAMMEKYNYLGHSHVKIVSNQGWPYQKEKPYLAWTLKDGKVTHHEKPKPEESPQPVTAGIVDDELIALKKEAIQLQAQAKQSKKKVKLNFDTQFYYDAQTLTNWTDS
jgi:hypothetical protein